MSGSHDIWRIIQAQVMCGTHMSGIMSDTCLAVTIYDVQYKRKSCVVHTCREKCPIHVWQSRYMTCNTSASHVWYTHVGKKTEVCMWLARHVSNKHDTCRQNHIRNGVFDICQCFPYVSRQIEGIYGQKKGSWPFIPKNGSACTWHAWHMSCFFGRRKRGKSACARQATHVHNMHDTCRVCLGDKIEETARARAKPLACKCGAHTTVKKHAFDRLLAM
jgi:hypothetical protein